MITLLRSFYKSLMPKILQNCQRMVKRKQKCCVFPFIAILIGLGSKTFTDTTL